MVKYIAGFALLLTILATVFIDETEENPLADSPILARHPIDVAQTDQGLRADAVTVTDQIWPWNNDWTQRWIDQEIARLEPLVNDPTHRELLTDFTLRTDSSSGGMRGLTYVPNPTGTDLLFGGTPEEQDVGKLSLLNMAKSGDAFAYYSLAIWQSDSGSYRIMVPKLYREPADREFLLTIVNFYLLAIKTCSISEDVVEAYLRFGMELGVDDGAYDNALNIVSFYVNDHPTRSPDGYLDRALQVISDSGRELFAIETQAYRLFEGIRTGRNEPPDFVHPIAYAFYAFRIESEGDGQTQFSRQMNRIESVMDASELAIGNAYLEQIFNGDFSQIPHIKDARPVTQ